MKSIDLLQRCLRYNDKTHKYAFLKELDNSQWKELIECARNHYVSPILNDRLLQDKIRVPDCIQTLLKQDFYALLYRNTNIFFILEKCLLGFQDQNISVILLKGAYLAEAVYSNAGLRFMSDIDLLVKKEDVFRAEKVLLSLGYKPLEKKRIISAANHHFEYKMAHAPMIELHWILHERNAQNIDIDGIWNRAYAFSFGQVSALSLSNEDLLLYACLHISQHVESLYLQRLMDIGEVVKKFHNQIDWDKVVSRAFIWKIHRAVYMVMALCSKILSVPIPDKVIQSLLPEDFQESYLEYLTRKIQAWDPASEKVLNSSDSPHFRKGLFAIVPTILTSIRLTRENISHLYSVPVHSGRVWLYFPRYWQKVLSKKMRLYCRMFFSGKPIHQCIENKNHAIAMKNWMQYGKNPRF